MVTARDARMTRTVLVTGGTGFAGSFLMQNFVSAGWQTHGTTRNPAQHADWLPPEAVVHRVDLNDPAQTRRLVAEIRPSAVAHLAAQSSVRESLRDPMRTYDVNTRMQMNVLDAVMFEVPHARVLVVGSGDEYGYVTREENPVGEGQELRPVTPYAVTKVVQDLMGYQYFRSRGLDVIRVRPFVQVGPRRSDQFVAGSFARQVAEIEAGVVKPVIEVGNIDLERDITDIRDVVAGYAELLKMGESGEVYNLGRGTASTLRQFLLDTMTAAGIRAEIRESPQLKRTGEPQMLIGNASKMKKLTGWSPTISLQQSAADTLEYWRGQVAARWRSAT